MSIYLIIKTLIYFLLIFLHFLSLKLKNVGKERNSNVVIIRLDALGDFVLWVNFARILYDHYSVNNKVILIGNAQWTLLASKLGIADEIISVTISEFINNHEYKSKILKQINQLNCHTVIVPVFSRNLISQYEMLVLASQAPIRICSKGYTSQNIFINLIKYIRDLIYTDTITISKRSFHKGYFNEILFNIEFTNYICGSGTSLATSNIILHQLPNLISQDSNNYIVISPFASAKYKSWPIEYYVELITILLNNGQRVIITGTVNDYFPLHLFSSSLLINLMGKTSLLELFQVIRNSTLVIANDSAAIHIAAHLKVPSLCTLWGGSFGRFLPYPSINNSYFLSPVCLNNILLCKKCTHKCNNLNSNGIASCLSSIKPVDVFHLARDIIKC